MKFIYVAISLKYKGLILKLEEIYLYFLKNYNIIFYLSFLFKILFLIF